MRLSQLAPLSVRRAAWRALERIVVPPAVGAPRPRQGPIVVAGLFSTANGIGESARLSFRALQDAGLSPLAYDASGIVGQRDMAFTGPTIERLPDTKDGFLIVHANAPELGRILWRMGRAKRPHWRIAATWAWETAQRPSGWLARCAYVDELWFPSRFVRDAIDPPPTLETHIAFHPVAARDTTPASPGQDFAPPGELLFVAYGDAFSSLYRKNPFGAIAAFKAAFGEDPGVRLIVKTRNAAAHPRAARDLAAAIGQARNIMLIDASLTPAALGALRERTNVLVSLHRSEGFGLTIAEAMMQATPVIATDWSASQEFLTHERGFPIPARLIPAEDPYRVYRERGHRWADPDLEAAAAAMRAIAERPAEAQARARAAQEFAREAFSAKAYVRALGLTD